MLGLGLQAGGMDMLTGDYHDFVLQNLASMRTLQILLLVLTLLLLAGFVLFMLHPFVKLAGHETRRVAELLSQLPAEVRSCCYVCFTALASRAVTH